MLAAPNRLKKRYEINRVYKQGAYGAASGLLSLRARPNKAEISRIAVVVSKKVDKRAVARNRMRRRISGLLREAWGTLTPGYDIVISVHSDVSHLAAPQLREALTKALARAGVAPR